MNMIRVLEFSHQRLNLKLSGFFRSYEDQDTDINVFFKVMLNSFFMFYVSS